jgi:hypothetical protein
LKSAAVDKHGADRTAPTGPQVRYSPAECIGTRKTPIGGNADLAHISTSYVARQNLTMRMSMRRFTRLTNAFSKKLDNPHPRPGALLRLLHFCRIHRTLKATPAMAAGVSDKLWSLEDIAERIEANRPQAGKRGPYRRGGSSGFAHQGHVRQARA